MQFKVLFQMLAMVAAFFQRLHSRKVCNNFKLHAATLERRAELEMYHMTCNIVMLQQST